MKKQATSPKPVLEIEEVERKIAPGFVWGPPAGH